MQVSRSRWQLLQDFGRLDCGRARSAHKGRGGFAGCHRTCRKEDVEKEERGAAECTGGETKGIAKRAP